MIVIVTEYKMKLLSVSVCIGSIVYATDFDTISLLIIYFRISSKKSLLCAICALYLQKIHHDGRDWDGFAGIILNTRFLFITILVRERRHSRNNKITIVSDFKSS